jgi:hypothetical protein
MDYRTWRKEAARVLRDRYDLAWDVMHEGAWMRLYVKGFDPDETAIRMGNVPNCGQS